MINMEILSLVAEIVTSKSKNLIFNVILVEQAYISYYFRYYYESLYDSSSYPFRAKGVWDLLFRS